MSTAAEGNSSRNFLMPPLLQPRVDEPSEGCRDPATRAPAPSAMSGLAVQDSSAMRPATATARIADVMMNISACSSRRPACSHFRLSNVIFLLFARASSLLQAIGDLLAPLAPTSLIRGWRRMVGRRASAKRGLALVRLPNCRRRASGSRRRRRTNTADGRAVARTGSAKLLDQIQTLRLALRRGRSAVAELVTPSRDHSVSSLTSAASRAAARRISSP